MTLNILMPLAFLETVEGKSVLGAAAFGALVQMMIFRALGFVRLLGLGHLPWVALVPWLWSRLALAPEGSPFRYWVLAVLVVDAVSLSIDAVDVARYALGQRAPVLSLDGAERS